MADTTLARSNLIGNIELRVDGRAPGLAASRAPCRTDPNLTIVNVTTIQDQLANLLGHERPSRN